MIDIPKIPYNKTVKDIDGFIERIKSKGFYISNEASAKDFLNKKGYYHISAYIKCFCETINGKDITVSEDIDFNNVISLYFLDKELQKEILNAVLEIEVLLKADFVQILSVKYNTPFRYTNDQNIASRTETQMKELIEKIHEDVSKSHACLHFFDKYNNQYLPIWHLAEFASFGSFTKIFNFLKDQDLFEFCKKYGAIQQNETSLYCNKDQLKQRLRGFCDLRNRLAHSEITRSQKALPKIVLPGFPGNIKINTISAYIQLIHHFLSLIDKNFSNKFFRNCFKTLLKIETIWGIHSREFNKIGLTGNRKKRFDK